MSTDDGVCNNPAPSRVVVLLLPADNVVFGVVILSFDATDAGGDLHVVRFDDEDRLGSASFMLPFNSSS